MKEKNKDRIETIYYLSFISIFKGNKQFETPYVNNKIHGLQIGWHKNGNKMI